MSAEIPNIGIKKFLRVGFRRVDQGGKTGTLQVGVKIVASRIGDAVFGVREAKLDFDKELAVRVRDRLTKFIEDDS